MAIPERTKWAAFTFQRMQNTLPSKVTCLINKGRHSKPRISFLTLVSSTYNKPKPDYSYENRQSYVCRAVQLVLLGA
jgi:hypothetical protein